ncbi:hypothetical protein JO84_gp291 [Aureococcus anophagefferens virus]|uniref:Uncharacterized protein n=1 Tax=Aureococcus anophagefferens virus TaxID=1474867 RepID=A0A076FH73_9VIRU|nr:hypothetical protein JO84_gp291 [Aureococcus anophagefferens virus]AII17107.1 hypothetical protein AaV_184 [Aureococcus anophagefferens virus]UOG94099.1 hypothetical protein MKD35_58 [Aureococcus anophagefferens virus]
MYCEFEQKKRRTCKNTSDPNKDPDQNCEIRNKKCYTRKIKNKPKIKMTRKKDKKEVGVEESKEEIEEIGVEESKEEIEEIGVEESKEEIEEIGVEESKEEIEQEIEEIIIPNNNEISFEQYLKIEIDDLFDTDSNYDIDDDEIEDFPLDEIELNKYFNS